MRATVYHGPRDMRVETVPDATLREPTDALVRVTHACICGSDLWPYRDGGQPEGARMGHEFMGVVEAVGADVRRIKPGDRVIAPFAFSDGECEFCRKGLQTSCVHGGFWGGLDHDGGQGEAVCAPFADGTLVVLPPQAGEDDALLRKILPLTDVMGTGHHAALAAGVRRGGTAAVVGDGAVGLCGVLAVKRLGAARIILLGRNPQRIAIARRFGATDIVEARGEEGVAAVREMTAGGVESALECVGTQAALNTAIDIARPGGRVGFVGVPHGSDQLDIRRMFMQNIGISGGVAPVRAYLPELLADVLAGTLDPSPVLDMQVGIEAVPAGYAAMDAREAIKVMVVPGASRVSRL